MPQEMPRDGGASGEETGKENGGNYFCDGDRKGKERKGGAKKPRAVLEVEVTEKRVTGGPRGRKEQEKWVRPPVVGRAAGVPGAERDSEGEGSPRIPLPDHSPSSSVASLRPLEWDSGADVGYFCYPSGSGEVGARCDPEGTTGLLVPGGGLPPPSVQPVAESTPKEQHHPLFPEVIVQRRGGNAPTPPPPPPLPPSHSTSSVTTVVTNSEPLTNPQSPQNDSFEWAGCSNDGDIGVDVEIERGVSLLSKLVDGKDPQARQALVRQVVKRILDYQSPTADKCIGTGESVIETSDWTSPRPSSSLPSTLSGRTEGGDISGESLKAEKEKGEWKKPVTKSEKLYSHHKYNTSSESGVDDKKLMEYLQAERKSQLEWIKSEISHLSSLQALLEKHETLKKNLNKLKKQNTDSFKRRPGKIPGSKSVPKLKSDLPPANPVFSSTPDSPDGESIGWSSHRYCEGTDTGVGGRGGSRVAAVQTSLPSYSFSSNAPHSKDTSRRLISLDELHAALDQILGGGPGPSLQDHLMQNRPDLVDKVEERRRIVSDLVAMREARSRKKRQILVQASNSGNLSDVSRLPPPPLGWWLQL